MNKDLRDAARLQFQDTRNALFLARLLAELDIVRANNTEIDALIRSVEVANGFSDPVPLRNQAMMLQMAYMTLVYPKQGVIGKAVGNLSPNLDWRRVTVLMDHEKKPRFNEEEPNWFGLLRTVRNALAHSSVEVGERTFTFTDSYEKSEVIVEFDWSFLGELTMEFFKSANAALYDADGYPVESFHG